MRITLTLCGLFLSALSAGCIADPERDAPMPEAPGAEMPREANGGMGEAPEENADEAPPDLAEPDEVEPSDELPEEPADPFADARAELESCVPAEQENRRWDEQDPGGLRVMDLKPLARLTPGAPVKLEVWLGNVSEHAFSGYPGLRLITDEGTNDNWFYAIFACEQMAMQFPFTVPADLEPGDVFHVEVEAVTLGCVQEDGDRVRDTIPCGSNHRVRVPLTVE